MILIPMYMHLNIYYVTKHTLFHINNAVKRAQTSNDKPTQNNISSFVLIHISIECKQILN